MWYFILLCIANLIKNAIFSITIYEITHIYHSGPHT